MALIRSGGKIVMKNGDIVDGQACCCECKPCPYCDAACLSVTFDGWDCTGVGVEGLCDVSSGDINGTFLLTRGRRRKVPVAVVTSTGSGAILWAVLGWDNEAATHYIAGVDIEDGGVDYAEGDTVIVDGNTFSREEICGKTPHVEITVEDGVIVSAEVTEPGEIVLARERGEGDPNIYPRWSCIYSRCDFIECESGAMRCRYITLEVTAAQRTLTVTFGDPFSYGASGASVLLRGELAADETPCDGLEFTTDDFVTESLLRPCAVGTAVVEPADCDGPPPEECCVPPTYGVCCGWSCDYVAEIIWPDIENPEDVPEVDPPEGWILNGPGFWTKVIEGVENCDDPDVYAAIKAELEAELDAVVAPLGGFSVVSLYPDTSGQHCINATEQECADTFSGTWYESQEECWGNCPNPLP